MPGVGVDLYDAHDDALHPLHHTLSTLNYTPSTLNPPPSTLNRAHEPRPPEHSTLLTYRGTSSIRNRHPPEDHHQAPGIGLL